MLWVAGSDFSASQTSYPLLPGMVTSARTRSGRTSRAREIASMPLSTAVIVTSSAAKIMPITLRMVIESSATNTFFGMAGVGA